MAVFKPREIFSFTFRVQKSITLPRDVGFSRHILCHTDEDLLIYLPSVISCVQSKNCLCSLDFKGLVSWYCVRMVSLKSWAVLSFVVSVSPMLKTCGHGGDVHTMFGTVYAWWAWNHGQSWAWWSVCLQCKKLWAWWRCSHNVWYCVRMVSVGVVGSLELGGQCVTNFENLWAWWRCSHNVWYCVCMVSVGVVGSLELRGQCVTDVENLWAWWRCSHNVWYCVRMVSVGVVGSLALGDECISEWKPTSIFLKCLSHLVL